MHAAVGSLAHDAAYGRCPPLCCDPLLRGNVLPARRRDAQSVEPLRLGIECRAASDVGEYLADDLGLFLDYLQPPVLWGGAVPEVNWPHVLAIARSPVEPGLRPLPDRAALVLGEAGEHLEDEPTRGVGGVYRLGGAL